jgi:hypothetical protein
VSSLLFATPFSLLMQANGSFRVLIIPPPELAKRRDLLSITREDSLRRGCQTFSKPQKKTDSSLRSE